MTPPRPWMVRSYPPKRRPPPHRLFRHTYSTWTAPFCRSNYAGGRGLIHRVRYVCYTHELDTDRRRTSIHFWCGMFTCGNRSAMMTEAPDAVCAACEGRAIGAGQIPQRTPPVLRYSPKTAP